MLSSDIKEEKRDELFKFAHLLVIHTDVLLDRMMRKIDSDFLVEAKGLNVKLGEAISNEDYGDMRSLLDLINENTFEFEQYCSLYGVNDSACLSVDG